MFGIFERGSKAGYIFLFIIILILIFLIRGGGVGPFGLVRGSREEEQEQEQEENVKEKHQVLYSRAIGKDTEVAKEVVEEKKAVEKQVVEKQVAEQNDKVQVLFDRVVGKSQSEEPTHTVLYTRTIG